MQPDHDHLTPLADLRLSEEERSQIRSILRAHVTMHAPQRSLWTFVVRHIAVSSLTAFLVLAGASTVLAQRSLPGDFFYPIKLAVNDRFAVAVAGDDDAKLDTELAQIDRILQEEEQAALTMLDDAFEDTDADTTDTHPIDTVRDEDQEDETRNDRESSGADAVDWAADIEAELRALERELKSVELDGVPEE